MSLGNEEKKTLSALHMSKAKECLRDAEIALGNQP